MKMTRNTLILSIFGFLNFNLCHAQAPEKMSYQAVIRDANNNLVINSPVSIRINILQYSPNGNSVFEETQQANTNSSGVITIEIGTGIIGQGSFGRINWASGPYFLKTEVDPAGGSNFSISGTSQLLSVPYAFYSQTTGDTSTWRKNQKEIYYNKGHVGIGTQTPDASALLDLSSSTAGLLPPRMTNSQRDAIINPSSGLIIFNLSSNSLEIFSQGHWQTIFRGYAIPPKFSDIDGNFFDSVRIGKQTWMKQNLNVSRYRNGDTIPEVKDSASWVNLTTGAWCWHNNDSIIGPLYGKLYNWYAVNDPRGLAPQGWHIPGKNEFDSLSKTLDDRCYFITPTGGSVVASDFGGGVLKETGLSHWKSPNVGATNSYEFSALGGGMRGLGRFNPINQSTYWWSKTENTLTQTSAFVIYLSAFNSQLGQNYFNKNSGYSVRCVKD